MLVPPSNSKDYISIRWTRQSSHQETPSWPSTRISTCLTPCLTFGTEIAASPTFLVRQQQQQQRLIRFSLVPTQALFTSPQIPPPTQYSIGIHPSRPSLASPKPSVSSCPWMMITHRRPLRGLPAFVTQSSLYRHSFHRGWRGLERRRNVKRRLGKRRISQRPLRELRSS